MGQRTVLKPCFHPQRNTRDFSKFLRGSSRCPVLFSVLGGDLLPRVCFRVRRRGGGDIPRDHGGSGRCLGPEFEFKDAELLDFVLDAARRAEGCDHLAGFGTGTPFGLEDPRGVPSSHHGGVWRG